MSYTCEYCYIKKGHTLYPGPGTPGSVFDVCCVHSVVAFWLFHLTGQFSAELFLACSGRVFGTSTRCALMCCWSNPGKKGKWKWGDKKRKMNGEKRRASRE